MENGVLAEILVFIIAVIKALVVGCIFAYSLHRFRLQLNKKRPAKPKPLDSMNDCNESIR